MNYNHIIINILITALSYMLIPVLVMLFYKKATRKNMNTFCVFYCLSVCIIYQIFNYHYFQKINLTPAFVYYTILLVILSCINFDKRKNKKKKIKQRASNKEVIISHKQLGNKVEEYKQQKIKVFTKKKKTLIGIIIFILILGNVILGYSLMISNRTKEQYKKQLKAKKSEIIELKKNNKSTLAELESVHNSLFFLLNGQSTQYVKQKLYNFDTSIAFVIEGYGNYWFDYDCMQKVIKGNYNFYAYNVEQAIALGYTKYICN